MKCCHFLTNKVEKRRKIYQNEAELPNTMYEDCTL